MLPKGSLVLTPAVIPSVYGPLRRTCRIRLPGLVRGRLQPQAAGNFTDGNQAVSLALHGAFRPF